MDKIEFIGKISLLVLIALGYIYGIVFMAVNCLM